MSANLLKSRFTFLAALLLFLPSLARSFEIPYFFTDPLRTLPDVVNKGVVLPGDTSPFPGQTQKDFSRQLTLAESVDLALSNNQKVKSAWADIKLQAASLGEAYSAYLPTINVFLNWTKDEIRYSDSRYTSIDMNRYTIQASSTWKIADFGGRAANRRSAEFLLAASVASHDAALQEALGGVIQAYFGAVTANAALKAKTIDEQIAKDTLNSAKVREAKGVVSQSDTLRAATALAKATLEMNRAHGDYKKAVAVLGHYLGLTGYTEISLPHELDSHGEAENKELRFWLDKAISTHPSIVAARKQLDAAKQQVTVAKSSGMPSINFNANYYQNTRPGEAVTPSGARETTLTAALSIPIFDGFGSTYKLRGAQAQMEQKASSLADMEQQIAMTIVKAHADASSALKNLESSSDLLRSAQNALIVSQRKYEKGAADITELLSTQSALADAWQERVRCLAEWHSARLQLLTSAGQMGRFAVGK